MAETEALQELAHVASPLRPFGARHLEIPHQRELFPVLTLRASEQVHHSRYGQHDEDELGELHEDLTRRHVGLFYDLKGHQARDARDDAGHGPDRVPRSS